jgi:nucleotide-binding universal stress UspA family protein
MVADAIQEAEGLLGSFHQCLALPASTVDFIDVGRPAAVIVEAAKRWSADLIAMGSHGRGGVECMLFGSVAEGVIRHAPCAVLIVPTV